MRSIPQTALALVFTAPVLAAGDLNVSVESGGSNSISVNPGATVNYQVVGELTDLLNEGLGAVLFDLSFDGGPLTQADAPIAGNMLHFTDPMGLSNPAGFGGTVVGGNLIQVGGAQNTFNNGFTAELSGAVAPGVAWLGSPEVLATGSFKAPLVPGTYTLSLTNLLANQIRQGEPSPSFWAVDEAPAGTIDDLTVTVLEVFSADVPTVSVGSGGTQSWLLDAGAANAGRNYWVFGSLSGTSPALPIGSVCLPLFVVDPYFNFTVNNPNTLPLVNSLGVLDGSGQQAAAAFSIPPGTNPVLVGQTVHHAYLLGPALDFASNAVSLTFLP
ncbi:MAG: hypothetical protein AAF682_20460 [Planctomycetota bacterium]